MGRQVVFINLGPPDFDKYKEWAWPAPYVYPGTMVEDSDPNYLWVVYHTFPPPSYGFRILRHDKRNMSLYSEYLIVPPFNQDVVFLTWCKRKGVWFHGCTNNHAGEFLKFNPLTGQKTIWQAPFGYANWDVDVGDAIWYGGTQNSVLNTLVLVKWNLLTDTFTPCDYSDDWTPLKPNPGAGSYDGSRYLYVGVWFGDSGGPNAQAKILKVDTVDGSYVELAQLPRNVVVYGLWYLDGFLYVSTDLSFDNVGDGYFYKVNATTGAVQEFDFTARHIGRGNVAYGKIWVGWALLVGEDLSGGILRVSKDGAIEHVYNTATNNVGMYGSFDANIDEAQRTMWLTGSLLESYPDGRLAKWIFGW